MSRTAYQSAYYKINRDKIRKAQNARVAVVVARKRALRREYADEVIWRLGGKCACCGEIIRQFLTVDHVKGGGTQHARDRERHGMLIDVLRLLKNDPKRAQQEYRVLCFNCNCGRERNGGVCPHIDGSSTCVVSWSSYGDIKTRQISTEK